MGRVFVLTDIHGNYKLFNELLEYVSYKKGEDTVIFNGDVFDRGGDISGLIKFLEDKDNKIIYIKGNHELLAEKYLINGEYTWVCNGGLATLDYIENNEDSISRDKFLRIIMNSSMKYEDKNWIVLHASPESCEDRKFIKEIISSEMNKNYIIGHTPIPILFDKPLEDLLESGEYIIESGGRRLICLDFMTYATSTLGMVDITNNSMYINSGGDIHSIANIFDR